MWLNHIQSCFIVITKYAIWMKNPTKSTVRTLKNEVKKDISWHIISLKETYVLSDES